MKIPLNDGWAFSPAFTDEQVSPAFDDSGFERVRLPHTAVETPFNCFDESVYQMVMTYRRHIVLDDVYPRQAVRLTFEGAAHAAEVYLDGEKVGEHFGGYTAFTVDLTGRVFPGKDHLIAVKLDSRESLNIPPFGHVIDYMTYGGLYREVFLDITRPVYIEDSYIRTDRILDEKKRLRIDGRLGGAGS
ncbi:MAG TPA: glycoside hydrolase family 2 protein, partial [Treponemataceae bacterium]|nr:glycoside hydrolase family 2 protein [Treponemataceae bacterium]HQF73833.1 glycoside hydrolase family 2 protein [Treponemataceae bacterium]